MSKLVRSLGLLAAVAALALAAGPAFTVAQEKKVDPKKADPTKKAGGGSVEIKEGKDGKFRFSVRDADDKYIAGSAAFATKEDAAKAVDTLKAIVGAAKITYAEKDK